MRDQGRRREEEGGRTSEKGCNDRKAAVIGVGGALAAATGLLVQVPVLLERSPSGLLRGRNR